MRLFNLSNRVALVTGGNGGIGLGMAEGMAEAGADIVIAGRNQEKTSAAMEKLQKFGTNIHSVELDITDDKAVRAMVDRAAEIAGRLDILVNNAGTSVRKQPEDLSIEDWHLVMNTNLTGAFVASQAAYPHMKAAGGGKMINIGSMMSIFGAPFATPYASSKGGIVQMTKALATAWAKDNIQVNAILPGWIDTALTQQARQQVDGLYERVLNRTPAGRWGDPEDHAGIAVFLAAAASDYVTGAAIAVDGGFSITA